MGVHKGQCPRITGRKQCRGTLSPASITGKKECRGYTLLASYYREEESVGVHSFLPVNKQGEKSAGVHSFFPVLVGLGRAIVWGYTLSCQLMSR